MEKKKTWKSPTKYKTQGSDTHSLPVCLACFVMSDLPSHCKKANIGALRSLLISQGLQARTADLERLWIGAAVLAP